ncbi:MAG: metallophosphoesterase [Spirochaetota bacterium]
MIKKFFFSMLLLGFLWFLYMVFIERYLLQVNTYHLSFPNLPIEFDGVRIVQISDLHYGFLMPMSYIRYVLATAMEVKADIIVATGDYVKKSKSKQEIHKVWPELRKLSAKYGVYMVLGNHDHSANEKLSLQYLQESGFSVRHSARCIGWSSRRLCIGGAGDFTEDDAKIDLAFSNTYSNDFKILLAHNPDTADLSYQTKVDLILAGHTHGGQFRLPYYDKALILPVKNKQYDFGMRKNSRGHTVFISKGIGWSFLPLRFNCLPELAVLQLHRAKRNIKIHD